MVEMESVSDLMKGERKKMANEVKIRNNRVRVNK
jgi:hypothetical protein